jgi:hypothetical protein
MQWSGSQQSKSWLRREVPEAMPAQISSRVYSAVLLLYPRQLRREFGLEMVEVFSEQVCDARRSEGWPGELRIWGCVVHETVRTLALAHMQIVGVSVASALIAFVLMSTFLWSMSR